MSDRGTLHSQWPRSSGGARQVADQYRRLSTFSSREGWIGRRVVSEGRGGLKKALASALAVYKRGECLISRVW